MSQRFQQDLLLQADKFCSSFSLLKSLRFLKYRSALSRYYFKRKEAVSICLQQFHLSRSFQQWQQHSRSHRKLRYRYYFRNYSHSVSLSTSSSSPFSASVLHLSRYQHHDLLPPVLWCHVTKNFVILSARVKSFFSFWRQLIQHKNHLHLTSHLIQKKSHHSLLQQTFGVWLMKSLDQMNIKRIANRIILHNFYSIQKLSFYKWKNLFNSLHEMKQLAHRYQQERHVELYQRLQIFREAMKETHKKNYFQSWKLFRHRRQLGRKFRNLYDRIFLWNLMSLAWNHWKVCTDLSIIVTCLQKYWRGYFSRWILSRNESLYLQWLHHGKYLQRSQQLYQHHLLLSHFHQWIFYLNHEKRSLVRNTTRVQLHRYLHKWNQQVCSQRRLQEMAWRGFYEIYQKQKMIFFIQNLKFKIQIKLKISLIDSQQRKKKLLLGLRSLRAGRGAGGGGGAGGMKSLSSPQSHHHRPLRVSRYHRDVYSPHHMRRYHLLKAIKKFKMTKQIQSRLQFCQFLATQKYKLKPSVHIAFQAWFRRAHRWALNEISHPIFIAHKHYRHSLLTSGWKLFQTQIFYFSQKIKKQKKIQQIIFKKYLKRQLKISLRRWYSKIIVTKNNIYKIQKMTTLQPRFTHWFLCYEKNLKINFKIKFHQIKIWKRILKTIFIAWKLFSIRSKRLFFLYSYLQKKHQKHIFFRIFQFWKSCQVKKFHFYLFSIVTKRSEVYLKKKYLKFWRISFYQKQIFLQEFLLQIFLEWKSVVKDVLRERKFYEKGIIHFYFWNGRWVLRLMQWRARQRKGRRERERMGTQSLWRWKCKRMLSYWRLRSWWLGSRVLHGRRKLLHSGRMDRTRVTTGAWPGAGATYSFDQSTARTAVGGDGGGFNSSLHSPFLSLQRRGPWDLLGTSESAYEGLRSPYQTPMRHGDLNPTPTRTPSQPLSSSFKRTLFHDTSFASFGDKSVGLSLSPSKPSVSQRSGPYSRGGGGGTVRSVHRGEGGAGAHLLVFGRTPLAHEACQLWAIRRWKRNITERLQAHRVLWKLRLFSFWKKYSFESKHRKLAATQRLRTFSNSFLLQKIFSIFKLSLQISRRHHHLTSQIQWNRLASLWNHWKSAMSRQSLQRNQQSTVRILLRWMSHRKESLILRRAFHFWRIKHSLSGKYAKHNQRSFLQTSFRRWRQLLLARRCYSSCLLNKTFERWRQRIEQRKWIRDRVVAQQKFVILILNKVRRRCHEWLREAFLHWGERYCSKWQRRSQATDPLVSIGNHLNPPPLPLCPVSSDWPLCRLEVRDQ